MAQRSQEKQTLINRIEASRKDVTAQVETLRQRLNLPKRLAKSVKHYPLRWLGTFTGAGFAASMLARKSGKKHKSKRLVGLAWASSLAFIKPRLTKWAIDAIRKRLTSAPPSHHPQPTPSSDLRLP